MNGTTRNRVARLNGTDGGLDPSFQNGMTGANGQVESLIVGSAGQVVIGGSFTTVNGTSRNRIARLNSNGSLDTGFQNGLSGANNNVLSVLIQPDNQVLVGGALPPSTASCACAWPGSSTGWTRLRPRSPVQPTKSFPPTQANALPW